MNKRQNLLNQTWTGAPIMIAGREIILSPVRYALLEYWGNVLFNGDNTAQNPAEGMGEMLLVCWMERAELKEMQRMTPAQRRDAVMSFMLENEDEVEAATLAMQERMQSVKASAVESVAPGKEDAPHAF
jgi:hypothetical protein